MFFVRQKSRLLLETEVAESDDVIEILAGSLEIAVFAMRTKI